MKPERSCYNYLDRLLTDSSLNLSQPQRNMYMETKNDTVKPRSQVESRRDELSAVKPKNEP